MRNCMVLIILLFIVLLVSSCQGYEAVSTVKFITQHGFSVERMPDWYLIHAVKQPSWKIHYGFDDNNKCHSSGVVDKDDFDKDDFEQQLKESIVKAVQLWLQPLHEGGAEIVHYIRAGIEGHRVGCREKLDRHEGRAEDCY